MLAHLNLSQWGQFDRNVRLILASAGIFAISFFGIQSLLKVLYLLRLGYGLEYIGLFSATGAITYMAMSLPSGAISNHLGMRRVMLLGGWITLVGMASLPLVEYLPAWAQTPWPILTQVILIVGWSLFSINMVPALMAATTPQTRNQAYAMNGMLRGLGTFIGTVSGGFLPGLLALLLAAPLSAPGPYRLAIWLSAALSLLGLIPLYRIRTVATQSTQRVEPTTATPFPLAAFVLVMIHVFLSHGGWAVCQAFCNAYMDADLQLSAAAIGLITGVGQFGTVLAPLWMPHLAQRYSNGWILLVTTLGVALSLVPLAFLANWVGVGLAQVGVLALSAMWMPAMQVFQMELVHERWRSLAYGLVSMTMGLTFAAVSLSGGYIAAAWGYRTLFLLGILICLVGAAAILPVVRRLTRETVVVKTGVESSTPA
jgi:MFS family permease